MLSHANSNKGEKNITWPHGLLHRKALCIVHVVLYMSVKDASCIPIQQNPDRLQSLNTKYFFCWEAFSRLLLRDMIGWG